MFVEIALSILDKTTITGEVKDYLSKLLSAISSLKSLYLDDFSNYEPHYDREDYIERLKQVRASLSSPIVIESPLVELHQPLEITMEQYNLFTTKESYTQQCERENKGEAKPEAETISMAVDGDSVAVTYPKKFMEQYSLLSILCICMWWVSYIIT